MDFLDQDFIKAMSDIGRYGYEKYGEHSFEARARLGDLSRGKLERSQPEVIVQHAKDHLDMYLRGELHDHFGTLGHQLAAVAFNAMMEYIYYTYSKGDYQHAVAS